MYKSADDALLSQARRQGLYFSLGNRGFHLLKKMYMMRHKAAQECRCLLLVHRVQKCCESLEKGEEWKSESV
ncbi:hypothetical protein Tco_0686101 [Tanacetum coccineum]